MTGAGMAAFRTPPTQDQLYGLYTLFPGFGEDLAGAFVAAGLDGVVGAALDLAGALGLTAAVADTVFSALALGSLAGFDGDAACTAGLAGAVFV